MFRFNPKRIIGDAWLDKGTRRPIYSATPLEAADLIEVHIKTGTGFKIKYVKPADLNINIDPEVYEDE